MNRLTNNILMVAITACGLYLAHLAAPAYRFTQVLTLGFGYVSLFLIALSLLIGPYMLLRRRRNPVNIALRRDAGIWAGVTGTLHVIYALRGFLGGNLWAPFLQRDAAGYSLRLNLFGVSNDVGLAATIILLLLLLLSNDISLRRLKGKRWKAIQRANYVLLALTVAHAIGYQLYTSKGALFSIFVVTLALLVVIVQLVGVRLYLRGKRLHPARIERGGSTASP